MCRNIRPLFNFEPAATTDEVGARRLGEVRSPRPASRVRGQAVTRLLQSLETSAPPKDREAEARKRRERFARRPPRTGDTT
jgi:hypothetical protein